MYVEWPRKVLHYIPHCMVQTMVWQDICLANVKPNKHRLFTTL